jgi:succinate dehydrogenase / fumarate reductase cytochrome b subunit
MFLNSRAAQGAAEYQWVPDTLDQVPGLLLIELFGIIIPILFHAILGVVIIAQGQPNSFKRPLGFYANFAYTLQRVTGVILFVMISLHVWQTWWQHKAIEISNASGGPQRHYDIYGQMHTYMSNDAWLITYALFVLIAAYHFGNGIFNFVYKWGITTSPQSMRYAIAVGLIIGFTFAGFGLASLWGLRFSEHAQGYTPGQHEVPSGRDYHADRLDGI